MRNIIRVVEELPGRTVLKEATINVTGSRGNCRN